MSDGMDGIGLDWLSYTAVTPRASLQSDANKICREASIGSLRIAHLGNSATFSMIARIGLNGLILTL